MKGTIKSLIVLVVLASIVSVGGAFAARNGGGSGRVEATISFAGSEAARIAPTYGDALSFSVDPITVKDRDLMDLWVANLCFQDGVLVSRVDKPVQYPAYRQGLAEPFSLGSLTWPEGGADCTAYVWRYPYTGTPLGGASMAYAVSG